MNDSQWPDTGRHRPKTVSDHSASLKADFDNVHHTMKASVSGAINLPANLRAQIAKGVTNGITEAESNYFFTSYHYCFQASSALCYRIVSQFSGIACFFIRQTSELVHKATGSKPTTFHRSNADRLSESLEFTTYAFVQERFFGCVSLL